MNTLQFTGNLCLVGDVVTLPKTNRPTQRLRFQVNPKPDRLGRITEAVNYYDVFIYGADEINQAWKNHNPDWPTPPATVTVQVVGRLRLDANTQTFYNNITLRLLKITWHYESENKD